MYAVSVKIGSRAFCRVTVRRGAFHRWVISPYGNFTVGTVCPLNILPCGQFAVQIFRLPDILPGGYFAVHINWDILPSMHFKKIRHLNHESNILDQSQQKK